MEEKPEITPLLQRAHAGDRGALEALTKAVYSDLVRLASGIVSRKYGRRAGTITLEPAALVNETFIKLLEQRKLFRNRQHFFAIATRIMLRVLADYHKARHRQKREGDRIRISLAHLGREGAVEPSTDVPSLLQAIEQLEAMDPRMAQVAKLRILWGFDASETSEVLGVSVSTVARDWRFARRWLAARLLPARKGDGRK